MSWLSDYIGKAENLLNALDSSAGDLLTNSMIEESSAGATATSSSGIAKTETTSDISSLSSSYLNQQSPLPSFSKHARTSSSSSGGGGGWGSDYRGRSGPNSPSPPLVGTKSASAKPSSTRRGSSALASTRGNQPFSSSTPAAYASTASAPSAPSHLLESSRLSQQLMRRSAGGSDYGFSLASTTTTNSAPSTASTVESSLQSKSNPVISSSSSSAPPPPPEDDLLSFLNAPKASTPISASRKDVSSPSLTPRASPVSRRLCDVESAPDFPTLVGMDNKSTAQPSLIEDETKTEFTIEADDSKAKDLSCADEESISQLSTSTGLYEGGDEVRSTEVKSESGTLIPDEVESLLQQRDSNVLQPTPSSNILEASESESVAPTSVTSSLLIEDPTSVPFRSNDYGLGRKLNVDSQQQQPTLSQISLKERQSSIYQEEAPQDIYLTRSSGKISSSNGSSESGASTDGEEADLSDAMKESPTSPFESEPEMVTSRDATPRGDVSCGGMVTSQEGMITSQEVMVTSSDIRYPSSGGLTESESEMVPSPPLAGDHLMTASQVSSNISQRFSDCEILSAAELAETEDENSTSPDRKVGVEEKTSAIPYVLEGVITDGATPDPAANEGAAEPAAKGNADSAPAIKGTVSSYAQGFFPLFEGVTSAFGEAFQTEQVPDPPIIPNATTLADEAESRVAAEFSATSSTSRLEFENELLRSEIHSLNEEMQGAWHQAQLAKEERGYAEESAAATKRRAKEYEDRMREMAEEFARERNLQAAQYDERVGVLERKLQETSNLLADVEMSLSAKDGQLAVLRVRLEEADAALEASRQKCGAVEEERRKIVADRESAVATHVSALETLKAHSDRLQQHLTIKTAESDRLREEVFSLETAFAEEKESLGSMVTSLQSEMAAEKSRSLSLQHQVNGAQNSHESVRKELDEYRAKATRTLQSKDRLIASLQEGSPSSSSSPAALLELEDVKSERDLLREEVISLQCQLESSRMELADAEALAVHDREMLEERLSSSTQELSDLRDKIETLSTDLATSKQELSCAHEQLHRDRIQFQEETLKQSEEKDDLKRQIETQASSSASSPDLEARLHALAENLISKQTTIESLTTEKTSLKLQLERLSTSATNTSNFGVGNRSAEVSIAVDENRSDFNVAQTRMRLPLLFREAPDDTGVTRGVKRAATTLDALGIKIGVFFRRYPIARVFALVYAFILHLWVFIVLLTYTPEMH